MKINLVAPTLSRQGGVERFTTEVATHLVDRGHELTLITGTITDFPGATVEGVPPLPLPKSVRVFSDLMTFGMRADRRLRALGDDAVTYRPLGAASGPGVVTALSCHAAWVEDRSTSLGLDTLNLLDRALLRAERRTYATPDLHVTTLSRRCAAEIGRFHGVDPSTIAITPPAVDIDVFRPASLAERAAARARLGLRDDEMAIGTVANYSFLRKQVALSSRACAAIGATFLVAGVPERSQVGALDEEVTQLLGPLSDMAGFFAALDAFVLPSVNEAYGMAAHEAMACGVPTVVSDRCGVADFFAHDSDALVVDTSDGEQGPLVDAFEQLRDARFAEQLSTAGSDWARARTWAHVTDELEAVFLEARPA
jgi:glycosyltransferase involved in cell wall biosynthesis